CFRQRLNSRCAVVWLSTNLRREAWAGGEWTRATGPAKSIKPPDLKMIASWPKRWASKLGMSGSPRRSLRHSCYDERARGWHSYNASLDHQVSKDFYVGCAEQCLRVGTADAFEYCLAAAFEPNPATVIRAGKRLFPSHSGQPSI